LEGQFPGLQDELGRAGAPMVDWVGDVAALTEHGWMPRYPSKLRSRACTRALLEHALRQRVRANPRVTIVDCVEVDSLLTDPERAMICGVRLSPRGGGGNRSARNMAADLVVDASGRASRAPEWLRELGFAVPDETVVNARLAYASRMVRLPESFRPHWKVLLQRFRLSRGRRGGGLYPTESGNWLVTMGGAQDAQPPIDETGFMEFAR
jgi:2-polyprenyl-6-methoxyphenol hydroxylase-like FAD-dependent oxidoreductase